MPQSVPVACQENRSCRCLCNAMRFGDLRCAGLTSMKAPCGFLMFSCSRLFSLATERPSVWVLAFCPSGLQRDPSCVLQEAPSQMSKIGQAPTLCVV